MDFNGHFRNKAYNRVRWACLMFSCTKERKEEVTFSMAIGNELVHKYFPEQSRMGTARMKSDTTDEERKQRVRKRVKQARKKVLPDGLSLANGNTILINNMVLF